MAETLRKVYAKIFRENLLNKFREEINKYIEGANKMKRHSCILPPLPKLGDLDVSKLELSNYFFS
jgi:DNA-directed RNA polymerase